MSDVGEEQVRPSSGGAQQRHVGFGVCGLRSGSASALAGRGRCQAREKQSETGMDTGAGRRSASPPADGRRKLEAAEGRRTHAVYLPRRDRGR
jgi:hypothetical protein